MKRFLGSRSLLSLSPGRAQATLSATLPALDPAAQLYFDDPSIIARSKSRWQMLRALAILQFCSSEQRVAMAPALLDWSRRLGGDRLWEACLRPTVYAQFVGGASQAEINESVRHLCTGGILPMLIVSIEEPESRLDEAELLQRHNHNLEVLLQCLAHGSELTPHDAKPQMLLKITTLVPCAVLQELGRTWLAETEGCPNTVPRRLVDHLAWALDTGGEELSPALAMPSADLTALLQRGLRMLRQLFDEADRAQMRILVDAEYEHINCGLAAIAYAAALRHNGARLPLVWNTFQCYLKRTPLAFEGAVKFHNYCNLAFGAKLVRGAYMVHERTRAEAECRASPVHESYEATSACYDAMVERLLQLANQSHRHVTEGIVATHNEASVLKAARRLDELGINHGTSSPPIAFGQVYGMADYLSYPLSGAGYPVYKSVPFGSVADTVPYLCRRAQENNAVMQGTRRERILLRRALFHK